MSAPRYIGWVAGLLTLVVAAAPAVRAGDKTRPPNVVFILADDKD
jgi:hypothetical protein